MGEAVVEQGRMAAPTAPVPVDVEAVDALLDRLRWRVERAERVRLDGEREWVADGGTRFLVVVAGAVLLREAEMPPLVPGDLLLLAPGARRTFRSDAGAEFIDGTLTPASADGSALAALMPQVLIASSFADRDPGMAGVVVGLQQELRACGVAPLAEPLVNALVGAGIRAWVASGCGTVRGWATASRHRDVLEVLHAIHGAPDRDWSVEQMARLAHSSRSRFVERFQSVVGHPPARYLADLRMRRGAELLRTGRSVAQVALETGYGSEAAFSRAFRRFSGQPPRAWARTA